MKLVMTLLVRDEEDIIATNIDFHLAQGVNFIIAMDNLSVDRTPQILREYERRGLLHYIVQTEDNYMQQRWVTEMARLASTRFGADWVINNDADEFWYSETGDLKKILDAISPSYDAVAIERMNFLPIQMQDGQFFTDAMIMREQTSLNALGQPLPPKVCHRAYPDIEVTQGNHAVYRHGRAITTTIAPISIFHFPMRSYRQFANKIALGGAAYARNTDLPADFGATWRHFYKIWCKGELEAYYRAAVADSDQKIREKRVVFDDRLKRYFAGRRSG